MKTTEIKEIVNCDAVSKKGDVFIIRKSYFYRYGLTAMKYRDSVVALLKERGIEIEVIDYADCWKPFRGGASVANNSHMKVVFKERKIPVFEGEIRL